MDDGRGAMEVDEKEDGGDSAKRGWSLEDDDEDEATAVETDGDGDGNGGAAGERKVDSGACVWQGVRQGV